MRPRRWFTALFLVLSAGVSLAQGIPNWPTPSSWTPPADELSKLVLSPPLPFAPITPCRVVDTRPSQGFSGAYGPPIMAANATRDFPIATAPHCPDIPDAAAAYSLNITVTETAGPGDIRVWPTGNPPLVVSTQNWPAAGATLANAAIVPAGSGGSITVQIAGSNTHLIIDINGVFYNFLTSSHQLLIFADLDGGAAILGMNTSTGINGFGVQGEHAGGGRGVYGSSVSGFGVFGASSTTGVKGLVTNFALGAAGVEGQDGSGNPQGATAEVSAGVRGLSRIGTGVLGIVEGVGAEGVTGYMNNGAGMHTSGGFLGLSSGIGIFSMETIGATGMKNFIEPHPTDPSKVIRFVSLEGNEPGTYFRGKARFERGLAQIAVPEEFRIVTDPEGLSIQVTPIGEMASVAVVRIGLDGIVVKGSRNVEFFYLVNGIRKAYKEFEVIDENEMFFIPEGPDDKLPLWLSEDGRSRLISNGSYNADGTVNLETARRLGWDKKWARKPE